MAKVQPLQWRSWIGAAGAVFLGGVLLFAAWAKAVDPVAFAEQIRGLGLDALMPAWPMALVAIAIEVGLGVALLLNVRRPLILVPAGLLVVFFLGITGREWWMVSQGLAEASGGCGCFGNLVQRTPRQAFLQDFALLVPALGLAWVGARGSRSRGGYGNPTGLGPWRGKRIVVALVAALAAMVFAGLAPNLPLDDLATRLKPDVEIEEICAGAADERVCFDDIVPELASGRHWVILTELDTPGFEASIEALNRVVLAKTAIETWVVSPADADETQAFLWRWGPAFDIRQAPSELLRPLYRRLPRSFEVADGRVTATFDGVLKESDHRETAHVD